MSGFCTEPYNPGFMQNREETLSICKNKELKFFVNATECIKIIPFLLGNTSLMLDHIQL